MSTTEKCSAGASELSSTVAAEKNQTGEKVILCHWKKSAGATEKIGLLH